jgi:hypothetical protein
MKSKTVTQRASPFGKVHVFEEKGVGKWSIETIKPRSIPANIPQHMVIPIQWVKGKESWVIVCTVSLSPTIPVPKSRD